MTLENSDLNMSRLSLNSSSSQSEDWDRSLILEDNELPSTSSSSTSEDVATTSESMSSSTSTMTPRNSVAFPAESEGTPRRHARESSGGYTLAGKGKRSLSELMRLHAEKGTDCKFSPEEASRVADVLGQWINASSSPYEAEDDFFRSQDDLSSALSKRASRADLNARPRGQSEGCSRSS